MKWFILCVCVPQWVITEGLYHVGLIVQGQRVVARVTWSWQRKGRGHEWTRGSSNAIFGNRINGEMRSASISCCFWVNDGISDSVIQRGMNTLKQWISSSAMKKKEKCFNTKSFFEWGWKIARWQDQIVIWHQEITQYDFSNKCIDSGSTPAECVCRFHHWQQ